MCLILHTTITRTQHQIPESAAATTTTIEQPKALPTTRNHSDPKRSALGDQSDEQLEGATAAAAPAVNTGRGLRNTTTFDCSGASSFASANKQPARPTTAFVIC